MTSRLSWTVLATVILAAVPTLSHAFLFPHQAPVVEYYHLDRQHYFMTADAREQRALDTGAAGFAWVRTGFSFVADDFPGPPAVCHWLAMARALDPQLSADAFQYILAGFEVTGEVYGDGEIGMNVSGLSVEATPRSGIRPASARGVKCPLWTRS